MKKKDIKKVHLMEHHSLAVKTEIYKFSYRNNFTIHPNTIEYLDMDIKDLTNWMIDNSISLVMGEEEYNDRIMVNSSLKLDFEELYNDKNALIQVVILPYHIPTLEDIAEEVGADIVNVTKGVNGYPMGLHRAITFDDDSFDWLDIEDIANIHNLEIVALHKRDGWNLWEKHYNANTPFNLTENMFGDNAVCWTDEGCFIEDLLERINGNCITNYLASYDQCFSSPWYFTTCSAQAFHTVYAYSFNFSIIKAIKSHRKCIVTNVLQFVMQNQLINFIVGLRILVKTVKCAT
jgi:hypothetical protein